jgi:hypothetical protein
MSKCLPRGLGIRQILGLSGSGGIGIFCQTLASAALSGLLDACFATDSTPTGFPLRSKGTLITAQNRQPFLRQQRNHAGEQLGAERIISVNTGDKKLNSAVTHCEGVQRGLEEERIGYGLCKIVDDDGDAITAEIPYTGFDYEVKFLEGTGKWKGIKGSLHSVRTVRSKASKGAMPGTYQGCRMEKGTFDLSK